ncbi:MAG: LytR C-terminal domain-containing protein [Proteobacteria bacterium]|nr:LytR C-terminal domain-containing protein [Pseudomonadota bacterium]
MKHITLLTLALLASLLLGCATDDGAKRTSTSIDYWEKNKGDCAEVLKSPHAYGLTRLSHCTKMWEMYRHVDQIPLKERSMYAVAFSEVSHKSPDPYDRAVADAALSRICIPRHPLGNNGQVREEIPDNMVCTSVSDTTIGGQAVASSNPFERIKNTVQVQSVPDRKMAEASNLHKRATAERKKKAFGAAIRLYNEALDANPFYVAAKYDLAGAQAISGDERGALRSLEELYTWNDPVADQQLIRARSDNDFESLRDNPNFKLLTGYVRIALVNGAGTIGESTVAAMRNRLESRNFAVAEIGKSNRPELVPQIWYREGFEDYAYRIRDALGQSRMNVALMRNADTLNDILVVWGQPEAAQLGAGQSAPVVQGKRAQGSDNKLDDLVKQVDDTKGSVDSARDTGKKLTP